MTPSSNVLLTAVAVAGIAWVCLGAWIVADRLVHDRRRRGIAHDATRLATGELDPARCSWRRLWRVADDHRGPAAFIAAKELVGRNSIRLVREGGRKKFERTHALRVLARGDSRQAIDELRAARADGAPDVIAASVAIAGEIDTPESDRFLIDVLVEGDNPRSRTADQLARRPRLVPPLLALTSSPDPPVRYWALMLLARREPDPLILAAALEAAGDADGQVRGAAARTLGRYEPAEIMLALRRLLGDEVFYVRAHAARAAGESGAGPLARDVAALLADRNWWVRAAAKESLVRLGDSGIDAAVAQLESADAFARDGAGEIILAASRSESAESLVPNELLEKVVG